MFPDFMTKLQDGGKVVSLTHRLRLRPENTPGTHFCWRLSRPQDHSTKGRIMSLENSNDTIGNRTRDLPVCSVVQRKRDILMNCAKNYYIKGSRKNYSGCSSRNI